MEGPKSATINVPVGPAVIAVGKNIVKTGQSIYIRVPSKTVTDQANNAFGTIHNEFDLGSQPRADPNRPLRQQALAWAKHSSSSQPKELTQELPVRIWEGVRLPQIPPKREPSQKLKESARRPENTRSPYALNIHANIAESALPTVIAAVRLTGIDGEIQDPDEIFNAVEVIWDTRAHGTIVSEDILSPEFRNYLRHPIHDPRRTNTGVRVQIDGEICSSNTILRIHCVCLVVPSSVMPNGCRGFLLGQRGAMDRIIYKSVPRANICFFFFPSCLLSI